MDDFKVVVAGGHDFENQWLLDSWLNNILEQVKGIGNIIIRTRLERGADTMATQYASRHGLAVERFPTANKSTGYVRNRDLVDGTNLFCIVWDGDSKEVRKTIELAMKHSVPVKILRYQKPVRPNPVEEQLLF